MNKITRTIILTSIITLQCCRYSFQGSLSSNIKSFYVEDFYTNLIDVPTNDIEEQFTKKLKSQILDSSSLKETSGNADIEFRGKITKYEVSDDLARLCITVEVDYINTNDNKASFKKSFSESIVLAKEGEEIKNESVDELLEKVINIILASSLYKW